MNAPMPALPRTCTNCSAAISGHYCSNCGQETRIELPTFRVFMREAAGRLVALDGRLWRTLWALVARPGLLTLEYFAGRRRRYVRPARLFLATSILLFAIIGLVSSPADVGDQVVFSDRDAAVENAPAPAPGDVGKAQPLPKGGPFAKGAPKARPAPKGETGKEDDSLFGLDEDLNLNLRLHGRDIIPEPLKARYESFKKLSPQQKSERLYANMLRFGPYAMVVLLPAFALLLKLAYLGSARRHPGRPSRYAEHLVYSAHLHSFIALALVAFVLVDWGLLRFLLVLLMIWYAWRARRNVYGGPWWAGALRMSAVAFAYTILISLAMLGLLIAAVLMR